jgi:hypothetical protein
MTAKELFTAEERDLTVADITYTVRVSKVIRDADTQSLETPEPNTENYLTPSDM